MTNDSTKNGDESLFMQEMADVEPLKPNNKIKIDKKPKPVPSHSAAQEPQFAIDDVFSDNETMEECPDIISFSRSGLQHNVLKRLRQGKFTIEHAVDLHGLTVSEARKALIEFFGECEAAGVRHAIIVHGKGFRSKDKPVIKPMVNRWLRAVGSVLAFHSALPKDGGSGAVYVLLRKPPADNDI